MSDHAEKISSKISIHAPAKGATERMIESEIENDISIHAPAKGATFGEVSKPHRLNRFQSTLPRRERRSAHTARLMLVNFNPRSREGSDVDGAQKNDNTTTISIHAPAKGATLFPILILHKMVIFQSTLPRRERLFLFDVEHYISLISIHAPAKGATLFCRFCLLMS